MKVTKTDPSRGVYFAHLDKREPCSREELAVAAIHLRESRLKALRRPLPQMERDGQLVFTR
ncbi:hypothetical protein CW304_32965, partial [Bacillus sp. UFRGS-B20]